jgi:hypothetical protein
LEGRNLDHEKVGACTGNQQILMALEWAGGAGELVPRAVRGASLQIRKVEMSETE